MLLLLAWQVKIARKSDLESLSTVIVFCVAPSEEIYKKRKHSMHETYVIVIQNILKFKA